MRAGYGMFYGGEENQGATQTAVRTRPSISEQRLETGSGGDFALVPALVVSPTDSDECLHAAGRDLVPHHRFKLPQSTGAQMELCSSARIGLPHFTGSGLHWIERAASRQPERSTTARQCGRSWPAHRSRVGALPSWIRAPTRPTQMASLVTMVCMESWRRLFKRCVVPWFLYLVARADGCGYTPGFGGPERAADHLPLALREYASCQLPHRAPPPCAPAIY